MPIDPVLEAKLDDRWALRAIDCAVVACAAVLYLLVSYLPITDPAVWNATTYGKWILEHRRLPTTDWTMPLAESMPIVDTQWLTEVVLAAITTAGDAWLATLAAVTLLLTLLALGRSYWLLSKNSLVAICVCAAVLAIGWTRYTALHVEHLAGICFAGLLWMRAKVASEAAYSSPAAQWPVGRWVFLAGLFCLWANLHNSFRWGLVVLACWAVGHAWDSWYRSRSLAKTLADAAVQRWIFALELALLATCLNPHGIDLHVEAFGSIPHANVRDLASWQPLVLLRSAGPMFAFSVVALVALLRFSSHKLPAGDALALLAMAVATIFYQRAIVWYAPLLGMIAAPHLAAIWRAAHDRGHTDGSEINWVKPARLSSTDEALPPGRSWLYSLLALLMIWIAFSFSDASRPLLGGTPRSPLQIYGEKAPLGLADYLRKQPPKGAVFAPVGWNDWLHRQAADGWSPMATSRVEALPRQVWLDHNHIASSKGGWRNVINRYNIRTLIVDREKQPQLATGLRLDTDWEVPYQDEHALVFVRKTP